jgi:hypothetical protein
MSFPRKRESSIPLPLDAPTKLATSSGYWIVRSSRAMTRLRHSGANRNPARAERAIENWTPAFAGVTHFASSPLSFVIAGLDLSPFPWGRGGPASQSSTPKTPAPDRKAKALRSTCPRRGEEEARQSLSPGAGPGVMRGKRGAPEGRVRLQFQGSLMGAPRAAILKPSALLTRAARSIGTRSRRPRGFHPRRVVRGPLRLEALLQPAASGRGTPRSPCSFHRHLRRRTLPHMTRTVLGHGSLHGEGMGEV